MEENKQRKLFNRAAIVLAALVLFIYILFSFLSTVRGVSRLTAGLQADSLYLVSPDQEMFSLVSEKAYLEARLGMSEHDSIGIVINLADSTVSLEMRGVRIHSSKASGIKNSKMLLSMNPVQYDMVFNHPLEITKQHASIVKEPVTVIDAPRDTLDASENLFMPDTSIKRSVNAAFRLERGITVRLIDEKSTGTKRFLNDAGHRCATVARNMASVFSLRIPGYRPEIIIYLPRSEIRTIYRALPANAEMVMKIR